MTSLSHYLITFSASFLSERGRARHLLRSEKESNYRLPFLTNQRKASTSTRALRKVRATMGWSSYVVRFVNILALIKGISTLICMTND